MDVYMGKVTRNKKGRKETKLVDIKRKMDLLKEIVKKNRTRKFVT